VTAIVATSAAQLAPDQPTRQGFRARRATRTMTVELIGGGAAPAVMASCNASRSICSVIEHLPFRPRWRSG